MSKASFMRERSYRATIGTTKTRMLTGLRHAESLGTAVRIQHPEFQGIFSVFRIA